MGSAREFWDWFGQNSARYFFLNQIDDDAERKRLLDEFLLDSLLGKKANALMIHHVEFAQLDDHTDRMELIRFAEFGRYLRWKQLKDDVSRG